MNERDLTIESILELCRHRRPPLALVSAYPPFGNRQQHDIDVIVATDGGQSRIAVEATLCYRGDRASGEAKREEHLQEVFRRYLQDCAAKCLGQKGYRVKFTIYFRDLFSSVAPRLQTFLRSANGQQFLEESVQTILQEAASSRLAHQIPLSALPDEHGFLHPGSQVYVATIPTWQENEYECDCKEPSSPDSPGSWRTVITSNFGTTQQALIGGIDAKRASMPQYRAAAQQHNATAVWLLLVVEYAFGLDMHAALHDEDGRLRAVLEADPQFDEVYVLAQGLWLPEGWDLERDGLDYVGGPIWRLVKFWPTPVTGSGANVT